MTQDSSGDRQEAEPELDELSGELNASIDRCRSILDDWRSKMAANSNAPEAAPHPANDDDTDDLA